MDNYYNPVRTICGAGSITKIEELVKQMNLKDRRILLLAWKEEIAELDAFVKLSEQFHLHRICFNESNPTVEQLFEVYQHTKGFAPEVVIAVGGGSVMDVGKSLCCFYGKEVATADEMRQMIADKSYGIPAARWIGVPTTSGTGSEVTCWATIWDPKKNAKRSVESRENYAYAAVVDPDLTKGMPFSLAVSSGLDAVAHAVESYWANGSNVVSRSLALGAIRIVMSHMEALLDGAKDAHVYMAQGSMIAGLAFSNTKTTACHSISYPLTMHYHIPHGTAVSMLLAPVMRINEASIPDRGLLLDALGVKSCGELEIKIKKILERAGIPATLKDWNVDMGQIPSLAAQGITKGRADNNPVNITKEMIEKVLYSICE